MASGLMEIMDLIYGFQKFQVLYSCTSLGVFEELHHHTSGPMSAEALATRLALHPSSLGRLMNAAVTLNLLNQHSAGPQHAMKYSNSTTVEKFIVKSSPGSLRALVNKMGDMYTMFGKLSDSVRKGNCPIPMAASFGVDINVELDPPMLIENMTMKPSEPSMDSNNIQQKSLSKKLDSVNEPNMTKVDPTVVLNTLQTKIPLPSQIINYTNTKKPEPSQAVKSTNSKKPEPSQTANMKPESSMALFSSQSKQMEFLQVMHMFSCSDAKQVNQAFDLSQFSTACDLGGGSGAIGAHIAEKNPHMNVIVYDLPHVIATASHFIPEKPQNLSFQAGDFFKSPLPSADLYILSHVVHDWSAKDVDILMKRVYNALPKGGAILVLEKCLNDTKTSPFQTVFFDIGMLVISEGQERTAQEYRTLLKRHRFSNVLIKFLPKAMYRDAILARKE